MLRQRLDLATGKATLAWTPAGTAGTLGVLPRSCGLDEAPGLLANGAPPIPPPQAARHDCSLDLPTIAPSERETVGPPMTAAPGAGEVTQVVRLRLVAKGSSAPPGPPRAATPALVAKSVSKAVAIPRAAFSAPLPQVSLSCPPPAPKARDPGPSLSSRPVAKPAPGGQDCSCSLCWWARHAASLSTGSSESVRTGPGPLTPPGA